MSNRLCILAAEVARLHTEAEAHSKEAAEKAIKAGLALIEAKSLVKHGEWMGWLAGAAINDRKAQRYMQIARSGLKSDTVSDLGGIKGTIAFLGKWQPPQAEDALFIYADMQRATDMQDVAYVWEDRQMPGHYHVFAICCDGDNECIAATRRPMLWFVEIEGEQPLNLIAEFLDKAGFPAPMAEWEVVTVERRLVEAVASCVAEPEVAA